MNRARTRFLVAVCMSALAVAACGSETSGADTAVGQALADELMSEGGDSPVGTEEEASCMAGDIVDNIGEDRLAELGVTADSVAAIEDVDFTDAEQETFIDALFDCVDVRRALTDEMSSDFGEEGAACLADTLDEDVLRGAMSAGFDDDAEPSDDFLQAVLDGAADCDLDLFG